LLFDGGRGARAALSGVDTMLEWLGNAVTTDELWRNVAAIGVGAKI